MKPAEVMRDHSGTKKWVRSLYPRIPAQLEPTNCMIQTLNPDTRAICHEIENRARGLRADIAGALYHEHRDRLLPVLNASTNTISSDLKRIAFIQESVRAFARRLLPLRAFATAFSDVPLAGTDEVAVPFFPLQGAASTDWNAANGYEFADTNETQAKKITVNKRKYQPVGLTSAELARQPFLNITRYGEMSAEKLANDVLLDVLSVVTLANFGAAVLNQPAFAFDLDDIIDIQKVCNDANWPDVGRSLVLNSQYAAELEKDTSVKLAANIGGTEVIRGGQLPTLAGFTPYVMPTLPDNGENLTGFVVHSSAILCAFSPVMPAPGVRKNLSEYSVATDPETGISMNFRRWGDAQMDTDHQVFEVAYGYITGHAAALKRIVSAE